MSSTGLCAGTSAFYLINYTTHYKPNDYLKDHQNADWLDSNQTTCTTDECLNNFVNVFSNVLNKHLPMVKKRIK